FGLRRSGLGILRVLIEGKVDLDLTRLLRHAVSLQPVTPEGGVDTLVRELEDFLFERLRGLYATDVQAQGEGGQDLVAPSIFEAVLAVRPSSPLDFDRRMSAIKEFAALEASSALAAANKRISNILRQAGASAMDTTVDPTLLQEGAEKALYAALESKRSGVEADLDAGHYAQAMATLAELREDVDQFFDDVMVMADDEAVRSNRLALLAQLRGLFTRTADISLLQTS
ncbi:MAG: glycine--tRNA ligase subunit beta, partial [Pseudomonadota bacterium]